MGAGLQRVAAIWVEAHAFHNQRPQAIAATGFPQPWGRRSFPTQAFHVATCHVQGSILICCYCNNVKDCGQFIAININININIRILIIIILVAVVITIVIIISIIIRSHWGSRFKTSDSERASIVHGLTSLGSNAGR